MELIDVLNSLDMGKISVAKAKKLLSLYSIEKIENFAKFDVGRKLRRGIPEVIFAEKKQFTVLKKIILGAVSRSDPLLPIGTMGRAQRKSEMIFPRWGLPMSTEPLLITSITGRRWTPSSKNSMLSLRHAVPPLRLPTLSGMPKCVGAWPRPKSG